MVYLKTLITLSVWEDKEHLDFSHTVDVSVSWYKSLVSSYLVWTYLYSVPQQFHLWVYIQQNIIYVHIKGHNVETLLQKFQSGNAH